MAWKKLLCIDNTGSTVDGQIIFSAPKSANTMGGGFIFSGVTDSAKIYYIEPTLNNDGRLCLHMTDDGNDPIEFVWSIWDSSTNGLKDHFMHHFDYYGYTLGDSSDGYVGYIKPAVGGQGSIGTSDAYFSNGYIQHINFKHNADSIEGANGSLLMVYGSGLFLGYDEAGGSTIIRSEYLIPHERTTFDFCLGTNWRPWHNSYVRDMYGKSLILHEGDFEDAGNIWYVDTAGTWYGKIHLEKNSIQLKGGSDGTKYMQITDNNISFGGSANFQAGIKGRRICIETDTNGYDDGSRSSEINNFEAPLYLQHATSNNIIACMGGGNFGINTDNPSFKLDVNGECGATAFYQQSDINLKTNIIDVDINKAKYVIENTRPVEFDWKKDGKHSQGVIAQEAEKIIPEAVEHGSEYLSVNYNTYIPYLIKMVQEQQKQIEELQKEIQELKKETPTK